LLLSLFAFNVGIEIGQLSVLAIMLPVLALSRRLIPERVLVIVLSATAACIGWEWIVERWQVLKQTEWPRLDSLGPDSLALWVAGLLIAFSAGILLVKSVRKLHPRVETAERGIEEPERAP